MVDDIFYVSISRRIHLILAVMDKFKRDVRMAQCHVHHDLFHISRLGHRTFQEFPSDRRIVKQIAHEKCRAVRSAYLLKALFLSAKDLIRNPGKSPCGFGDNFHLSNRADA